MTKRGVGVKKWEARVIGPQFEEDVIVYEDATIEPQRIVHGFVHAAAAEGATVFVAGALDVPLDVEDASTIVMWLQDDSGFRVDTTGAMPWDNPHYTTLPATAVAEDGSTVPVVS